MLIGDNTTLMNKTYLSLCLMGGIVLFSGCTATGPKSVSGSPEDDAIFNAARTYATSQGMKKDGFILKMGGKAEDKAWVTASPYDKKIEPSIVVVKKLGETWVGSEQFGTFGDKKICKHSDLFSAVELEKRGVECPGS